MVDKTTQFSQVSRGVQTSPVTSTKPDKGLPLEIKGERFDDPIFAQLAQAGFLNDENDPESRLSDSFSSSDYVKNDPLAGLL